jgi:hypothetical protein
MDFSSSCPLELTTIHPKPASQQRACSSFKKRSASVLFKIAMKTCCPSDPGTFSPVSVRNSPAEVDARVTLPTCRSSGRIVSSAGQNPPSSASFRLTASGMPLVS